MFILLINQMSSIRMSSIHIETKGRSSNVKVSLHLTNAFFFSSARTHNRMSDLQFPIESPYKWKGCICTYVVILEINEKSPSTSLLTRVQMRVEQTIELIFEKICLRSHRNWSGTNRHARTINTLGDFFFLAEKEKGLSSHNYLSDRFMSSW